MNATGDNDNPRPRRSDNLLSALCYTLWHEHARAFSARTPGERSPNNAVRFAVAQLRAMPDVLRVPVRAALALLDAHALLRYGRRYTGLDHPLRFAIARQWRTSAVKPCRDLICLFDALVLFAMASETSTP